MARVQVLSLGEMADVERQLESAFDVVRATGPGIEAAIAARGPAIRAIATRGRDRIGEEMLARLPALELIANFGVGYDSIDVEAARRHGVVVTNTPEVLNDEVADLAMALERRVSHERVRRVALGLEDPCPELGLVGLEVPELVDRIIVGPCDFPVVTAMAFREVLCKLGVPNWEQRVIVAQHRRGRRAKDRNPGFTH